MMPKPKDVFDHPEQYWKFITAASDDKFEGQHFDRKEAGYVNDQRQFDEKSLKDVKNRIIEGISGFANENREGGLLVLGVSTNGEVKGINHLTVFSELKNHAASTRIVDCQNNAGLPDKLLLNLWMNEQEREQLKRDKIVLLVKQTLERLALTETPDIHFHYLIFYSLF